MPRIVIPSVSGGLWLDEGRDFASPPDSLLIADNVEYLRSGGVIGRRGRTKLNTTALDGGDPIRALWRHYPRTGTKNTLAFVDVGASVTAYKADDSSGTFASATASLPDDAHWAFANWPAKNKTFLVSGVRDGTGTGGLREWNGTAVSAVTAGGTNEVTLTNLGPYITLHKSRLFATKLSELNFSVYASENNGETVWLSASQLSVNDPQGGLVTGLSSFFDFLLIFKQTSLFRFIGSVGTGAAAQLALYSDYGCVAPSSIAVTPYGVLFVGRAGVYLTDGVNPNPPELSLPIRSLFVSRSTQTQYPDAIGRWYPNKQQYVLKLDPVDEDAYVLTRLEILAENVFRGERSRVVWLWSHHTNLPMISAAVWESEVDDGRLIVGDSVGFIRTYDTGADDDGTAITATTQTASIPIDNEPERARFRSGRVKRVKLLHRSATVLSGELLYDQAAPGAGAPFTIGDTTLDEKFPRSIIDDQALMGRFVSLWLQNTASSADYEVHVADMQTRLLDERVWRDDNDGVSTVTEDQGNVTISGTATEAVVTFAVAQTNTDYEVAFGLYPSAGIGPTTVGIKPGTKATTGFTAEVGGAPGVGNTYSVMWLLQRAI